MATTNKSPTNETAPTPEEPPRTTRLRHQLPRAGLILFLLAAIVVFYKVLLPFVLAVFFAYLIYPVVSLIERIPFGRRHAPRWLAVITVYAVVFTIGWNTIPPLVGSLLGQVRKLAYDAPGLFHQGKAYRNQLDVWIKERLEVTELNQDARTDLFDDVEALRKGKLVATLGPEGQPMLPPLPGPKPPASAEAGNESSRPVIINNYSFIHVDLSGGRLRLRPSGAGGDHAAKGATEPPGGAPTVEEPGPVTAEGPDNQEQPPRFTPEAAAQFKTALKDAINLELRKPGLATGLPARVESEIVPELARRHLNLDVDDPQVRIFAHNAGIAVASAISQEDYATFFDRYAEAGAKQAQLWIQEQLKGLYDLVAKLASGIFDFFMILMLTAFFLVFFPRVRDYLRDLVSPQFRDDYAKVLKRIDRRLSGAIRGQVIICMINGALTFPGLWYIGKVLTPQASNLASYSVLLSVVAGVLSLIPIFGVILSTVPMVVLALTQHSVGGALLVILWISIIHSIEAYILNPNILGHSASMNPIIVVFALLAGREVGGLIGALLAVPIASVVVSLFGYYRRLVAESAMAEQGGEAVEDVWDD